MKDFDNYEVYVGKNALRVVREGYSRSFYKYDERYEVEGTYVPLGIALANFDKPFITFGLPKKLKKYIENRAKNIVEPVKSKKGKFNILVPGPAEGKGMWVFESTDKDMKMTEKNKKTWFCDGSALMTVEEATVYAKLFDKTFFSGGSLEADGVESEFNAMLK
ncbi:MAG: hypothetical protein J1D88_09565 [Treponema sp.]|nr:hypothetical protein [Treponema sp.]